MIIIKKIINYLLSSKYRRINLTTIASLIVFLLILLISSSSAYYVENTSFPLINALVGDYIEDYDIILKIYVENNNKLYTLSNNIPDNNYEFNHYICSNNSLLTYDQDNKLINILTEEKEQCNVYFNLVNNGE